MKPLLEFVKRHRVRLGYAVLGLGVALLAISICRKPSPYELGLIAKGFPSDYAKALTQLHRHHPYWQFEPLKVDDLTWSEIVTREMTPGWNLVSGGKWAPEPWRSLGAANHTPYYDPSLKTYDTGAWYQASKEAVAYFMDPRNFLNDADIFMFEALDFNEPAHTEQATERALEASFMANAKFDGGRERYSELLVRLGRRYRTSPIFLASRLRQEQGLGTVQTKGTIGDSLKELYANTNGIVGNARIWGKRYTRTSANTLAVIRSEVTKLNGYYNFFNLRACGEGLFEIRYNAYLEAVDPETKAKYCGPWDTQAKAIEGGIRKIKEEYIDTKRHTRYFQKFSVVPKSVKRWSQYMQNISAPLSEARNTRQAYVKEGLLDAAWRFVIPVYRKMPAAPCKDPAGGRSMHSPTR